MAPHPSGSTVDGQLRGERCGACDRLEIGHLPACPGCGSRDRRDATVSGAGVLYASTVVRVGRAGFAPPYALGYVDLDDGPRVLGRLDDGPGRVPGRRVRGYRGPVGTGADGVVRLGLRFAAADDPSGTT